MNRQIISTVGTSILTNKDGRPWGGWNPRNSDPLPDADVVDRWLSGADNEKISAETNTLRLLELQESDAITLLHSATDEGQFCAQRLESYYTLKNRKIDLKRIDNLGYGAKVFSSGLNGLVDVTFNSIEVARKAGRIPILSATGGFKAEAAYLTLIGALTGIEVVYIHELHRDLVRLPRLPIGWDAGFVGDNREFFEWIDAEPRESTEVESWLKSNPPLRELVVSDSDGNTFLNTSGYLVYKAANAINKADQVFPEELISRLPRVADLKEKTEFRPRGHEDIHWDITKNKGAKEAIDFGNHLIELIPFVRQCVGLPVTPVGGNERTEFSIRGKEGLILKYVCKGFAYRMSINSTATTDDELIAARDYLNIWLNSSK